MPKLHSIVRLLICVAVLLKANGAEAQEPKTLSQVLQRMLDKHFAIQLARTDAEIAKQQVSVGNAGMLPGLSLSAAETFQLNNARQELANNTEINRNNARAAGTSVGISLGWTLFDGMQMFVRYDQLKANRALSEEVLRQQVETGTAQTITLFYRLLQQQLLVSVTDSAIQTATAKTLLAKQKWESGLSSKLEWLQASAEANNFRSQKIEQETLRKSFLAEINLLMGANPAEEWIAFDSLPNPALMGVSELNNAPLLEQNSTLRIQKIRQQQAELDLKFLRSDYWPRLNANAGYNFIRNTNQAGFILLNQNLGLNAGISLQWNLFNGFQLRNSIRTAESMLNRQRMMLTQTELTSKTELQKALNEANAAAALVAIETNNATLAREAHAIALDRYRNGLATYLETKDVQQSLLDAQQRLINARCRYKIAETEIQRISGKLKA